MSRLFGTDGVRGLANRELTAALALGLSQASAVVLTKGHHADARRAEGNENKKKKINKNKYNTLKKKKIKKIILREYVETIQD